MIDTKDLTKKIQKESNSGNVKTAIELCQLGLQKEPTNADLHLRLGDLYLKWHLDIFNSHQYIDEAITEYQRALETYIDSAEIYFKIGRALFYKGDLDKCINYLMTALEKDKKYDKAYLLLAESYTKKTRFTEAIEYAKSAIKYKSFSNSCAHYLLANLYGLRAERSFSYKLKSYLESLLSILTLPFDSLAISNVFKMIKYFQFIPILIKGFLKEQASDYVEAIEIYSSALEKAPGFIPLYYLLGDAYRSVGQYDEAVMEYKMAIWLDSLNIAAYRHLCQVYEEQGDYDNAIEMYKKLIEITPNIPDVHSNLANILYVKGDIEGAISHFQTAITLNPKKQWTSVINQTLGYVFQMSKNDINSAISAYQGAYLLTPEDIDIYINLGSAFYDKDDVENALVVYRNALELNPKNSQIHCNLGFLYWGKGDIDEAIKEYNYAIEYNPNYDIAYNNLGVIYLDDLGRVSKAIDLFKKSIECNPNYALAYFNLARAITITGDKIEAAKLYQTAQDINKVTNEMDPQEIIDKINDLFE